MEKTKCGSHAKKCHRRCHAAPSDPVWGQMGEWTPFSQHYPLSNPNDSGYNWEDVLVISEMTHAQEAKTWAERLVLLDKAYKSKIEKLKAEYENAMSAGYEEAYQVVQEARDKSDKLVEDLTNEFTVEVCKLKQQIAACHKIIQACCPEKLVALLTEPHGENQ